MKYQIIMFIVMVIIDVLFNPMNILAYIIQDLYFHSHCFMVDY